MTQLTDSQIWQEIVQRANLGDDKEWLTYTHHEIKRSTLFLRKLQAIDIPEEVIGKLRVAAASMDLRLRVTDKWATMADLKFAVGDVKFLWKEWIPKGFITLFAGESKTGKSKLAQWLCKVVIEGLPWPDGSPSTEMGNVIYIDAEGSQILASNSSSDMGLDLSRMHVPDFGGDMLGQPDLNDPEHRAKFTEMIVDLKPSLVIIDSMGGVKSGGENKKEEMQPTMLYLNHLAQEHQFALVIIHHLNKTKREEEEEIAIGHVRGSTAIIQFSRSVIFLSRKVKGLRMWVGGSNVANFTEIRPLKAVPVFEEREKDGQPEQYIKAFEFELWADEQKTTKIEECCRWVAGHLASRPPDYLNVGHNIFELGDEKWTIRTIKEAGSILERKGIITRTGGRNSIWKLVQLPMIEANGHHQEDTGDESDLP